MTGRNGIPGKKNAFGTSQKQRNAKMMKSGTRPFAGVSKSADATIGVKSRRSYTLSQSVAASLHQSSSASTRKEWRNASISLQELNSPSTFTETSTVSMAYPTIKQSMFTKANIPKEL